MNDLTNKFYSKVIMVPPPLKTLTFPPVKDAMVYEGQPLLDYGDYTQLSVSPDADGKKFISLLGWKNLTISKQAWAGLKSITLVMQTGYESKYANTLNLYEINDDSSWSEGNVNWVAKPAYSATPVLTQTFAKESSMVIFDLTSYFKAKGNPSGTDFGFALQAAKQTAEILSFASKENSDSTSTPKLLVSYYDLGLTPKIATINGHITSAAIVPSADITCTVIPEGKYVEAGIYGSVEPGKGAITPVDINAKITVQQRLLLMLDGTVTAGKGAVDNKEITAHFFGAGYVTTDITGSITPSYLPVTADITGKITVSNELKDPVDITGTVTAGMGAIGSADITGAVTAGKGKINRKEITGRITATAPIDPAVDIIGKLQPSYAIDPVDITGAVTAGMGAISAVDISANAKAAVPIEDVFVTGSVTAGKGAMDSVDLPGHIDKVYAIAGTTDIPATFTLGHTSIQEVDINGHIVASKEMPAVDINGRLQPSYEAPSVDINGHIVVIPVVYEEIDGHITASAVVDVDIDCHVIALQRLAVFVDGHVVALAHTQVDIDSTVSVLAHGQADINCQVTVAGLVLGKSYAFIV